MGAKLGSGSSGRLYRGNYRGQDVAVKVIRIMEGVASTTEHSGTFRNQSASELLQLFKQEVSIMRFDCLHTYSLNFYPIARTGNGN